MTALADRPAAASLPLVARRPCEPEDLGFLRELFAQDRDELLLLTPDTRDVVLDTHFRAHRRRLRADHPRARHEVIVHDGLAVGRLVVDSSDSSHSSHSSDSSDSSDTVGDSAGPELLIVDLAVRVDRRGRGIGSAVLASVVAQAAAAGRTARLLAWSGEAGVRRFYLRHGFTTTTDRGELVHVRPGC